MYQPHSSVHLLGSASGFSDRLLSRCGAHAGPAIQLIFAVFTKVNAKLPQFTIAFSVAQVEENTTFNILKQKDKREYPLG